MAGVSSTSCSHIKASGGTAPLLLLFILTLTAASSLLGAAAGDPPFSCGPSSAEASGGYGFCDAALPAARRAADLVAPWADPAYSQRGHGPSLDFWFYNENWTFFL
uniref:Uncharacterized protein n=1 Tax=Arundo donax TaxID=35708 RepID=A0A0A9GEG6_ARUDO